MLEVMIERVKRSKLIDDLVVADAQHGVKIAKLLFAGRYQDIAQMEEGIKTIGTKELVKIVAADGTKEEIWAKVDTGAWRTSIDKVLAKRLGLLQRGNVLWVKKVKTSMGVEKRPVINLRFYLAGRRIDTMASIANRGGLRRLMIIGRRDLGGFLVKTDGLLQ